MGLRSSLVKQQTHPDLPLSLLLATSFDTEAGWGCTPLVNRDPPESWGSRSRAVTEMALLLMSVEKLVTVRDHVLTWLPECILGWLGIVTYKFSGKLASLLLSKYS